MATNRSVGHKLNSEKWVGQVLNLKSLVTITIPATTTRITTTTTEYTNTKHKYVTFTLETGQVGLEKGGDGKGRKTGHTVQDALQVTSYKYRLQYALW